jgi:Flp pilus assembly protein TadB
MEDQVRRKEVDRCKVVIAVAGILATLVVLDEPYGVMPWQLWVMFAIQALYFLRLMILTRKQRKKQKEKHDIK